MSEDSGILTRLVSAVLRKDGWENILTGFGTARDKTTGGEFKRSTWLVDQELVGIYEGDAIAQKIVNIVPREMYRQGFNIDTPADDARILARARALDTVAQFKEASIWGRLYGGCLIFVGADDGGESDQPLNEEKIRSVEFLQVFDRRYAVPHSWYDDPSHPKYGHPQVWRLTSIRGRISWVHETRVIKFGGAHTDPVTRHARVGWDLSVLQAPYEVLRAFWANHKGVEHLVTDASQGVFKIANLMGLIAAGREKDLQTRAILMDQTRSLVRAIMLDASTQEDFQKVQTTFSGIADVLDRTANLLAAATEIPVTILMGQAPAGLNATGEADVRTFYDRIRSEQETDAKPKLERLCSLIARGYGQAVPVQVSFPSLWQETRKERAEINKLEADAKLAMANALAAYVNADVHTPEEVALANVTGVAIDPRTRTLPTGVARAEVPGANMKRGDPPPDGGRT